jgi:hypothetical protein
LSESYIKLRSNYLDSTVNLSVILPNPYLGHNPARFYTSGKKYPVLWLLHGGSETYTDWITYTSIARLAVWKNTVIIAPTAPNSDFINQSLVGEGYKFFDFFFEELMPFAYNWLPVSDEPANNFLAGYSMGCEAVWRYGLLKPDAFGCIAPLGDAPKDYRFLESYRGMTGNEFRQFAESGELSSAGESRGKKMRPREINNIFKYETVGGFLDSFENTLARVEEKFLRLPKVFFPYYLSDRNPGLKEFLEKANELGKERFFPERLASPLNDLDTLELAVEMFMDYVGLENIEKNDGTLPILTGVNNIEDDSNGITLH